MEGRRALAEDIARAQQPTAGPSLEAAHNPVWLPCPNSIGLISLRRSLS